MTPPTRPDLACFGYLANATIVRVGAYPHANSGAVATQVIAALAGDAPITAITARGLGLSATLVSNPVGVDPAGQAVLDQLNTAGVAHHAHPAGPGYATPQLSIITDDANTRTWFAWLGWSVDQLGTVDLSPLAAARLAYIDCYRTIEPAAIAAIAAAGKVPLLLNFGGDPLSERLTASAANRNVAFIQTSLDEHDAEEAEHFAHGIAKRVNADTVVVTVGRHGAIARTANATHRAEAPQVNVSHTHGAGAAFSAGLAHAYLNHVNTAEAVRTACAVGSAHCAEQPTPRPRFAHPHLVKEPQQ